MKLYLLPGAPNPTKVALYVAEKEALGVDLGLETEVLNPFKGEQKTPEHLARNPFGTLPVLHTDVGNYLFESLAIMEFLEEKCPEPSSICSPHSSAVLNISTSCSAMGVLGLQVIR